MGRVACWDCILDHHFLPWPASSGGSISILSRSAAVKSWLILVTLLADIRFGCLIIVKLHKKNLIIKLMPQVQRDVADRKA